MWLRIYYFEAATLCSFFSWAEWVPKLRTCCCDGFFYTHPHSLLSPKSKECRRVRAFFLHTLGGKEVCSREERDRWEQDHGGAQSGTALCALGVQCWWGLGSGLQLASPSIKTFMCSAFTARCQRTEQRAQSVFQGVNVCDVCACPPSVSVASLLIKNCSNQPRGLVCEAGEPKLLVNSVQIQWVVFTHARNGYVSFLHFETKYFHFKTNLISFLECEMIILFSCREYSWVDPSH